MLSNLKEGALVHRPYTAAGVEHEIGEILTITDGVAQIEWFDGSLTRLDLDRLAPVERSRPRRPSTGARSCAPRRRRPQRRDPLRAARRIAG